MHCESERVGVRRGAGVGVELLLREERYVKRRPGNGAVDGAGEPRGVGDGVVFLGERRRVVSNVVGVGAYAGDLDD